MAEPAASAGQDLTKRFVQLLLIAGIGGYAGASEILSPTSGELLERVIAETESGNFESAWKTYEAFFAHPRRNSVPVEAFGRCFYGKKCFGIGALGALLDKTPEDAAGFWSFCPDWTSLYPDETPEKLEAAKRRFDGFIAAALGATCPEWASREVGLLEEQPHVNIFTPQTIALVPTGRGVPSIDIEVNGRPLTAMLDTGSSTNLMNAALFAHELDGIEYVSWSPGTYGLSMYEPEAFPVARLEEVRVGAETFRRLLAALLEFHVDGELVPADKKNIIGMNLLLKYSAVCFDWVKRRVHLGTIGACAGVAPSAARFNGSFQFEIHVEGERRQHAFATIDTGSDRTYCSAWFGEGCEHEFSFGDHSGLKGRCTFDEGIHFGQPDTGDRQVVIGMDTLLQFAALGWELNPFRVYFVPKETGDAEPASEEPVAEAPEHRLDGSAGQAVHRRGQGPRHNPRKS